MIKKSSLSILFSLVIGAAIVVKVCAKDEFSDKKFRDLLMEQAEDNDGMLELDFDLIKEMLEKAGMPQDELKDFDPEKLLEFFSLGGPGSELIPGMLNLSKEDMEALDKQYMDLVEGHEPATTDAAKSTVAFLRKSDKKLAIMGTIISKDGLVVTKASEYQAVKGPLLCDTGDGKTVGAKLVRTFDDHDIAVIQIDRKGTRPIRLYDGELPDIGAFLAAPGPADADMLGIGVLSVLPRSLRESDRAFLGIGLESSEKGIRVLRLFPGTPAEKAGLTPGDIITELDGKTYSSVPDFINAVSSLNPGDRIKLSALRDNNVASYDIKLGSRPEVPMPRTGRFERMNNMGTRLSDKRDGYPNAFQHDIPIEPEMCGGPVVDLDGNVLGVNISRAGRVKTYAVPATVLKQIISELKNTTGKEVAKVKNDPTSKNQEKIEQLAAHVETARKAAMSARQAARKADSTLKKAERALAEATE